MLNFQKGFFYLMIVEFNGFLMSVLSLGLAQMSSDERGGDLGSGGALLPLTRHTLPQGRAEFEILEQ